MSLLKPCTVRFLRQIGLGRTMSFAVGLALMGATAANAQTAGFPNRAIQIVVPVAAGGGTDLLARTLGQKVSDVLGQPVVIENKLGAGGNLGVESVAKSKPDGHTLLISPGTIATNVTAYKKLPYDLIKDFQAVTLIGQTGVVLVVHPSMKVNTLQEFVELAKKSPGQLNFGSAGLGSPQQLHSEFFNQLAGLQTNHIPYKGQSQAMTDLVGGQLNYMFSPLQNALPYIQQGRIRAIAVAMIQRSPKLPNVPTLNELGYRDVEPSTWLPVHARRAPPPATIKKLNAAFVKVGQTPEMKAKFDQLGFDSFFNTPDQAQDFMRSELVRWARVAAYAGIKPE